MRGPRARVSSHISSGDGKAVGAVIGQPDRQEAEHERTGLPPEPEILVQQLERGDGEDQPNRTVELTSSNLLLSGRQRQTG